MSRKKNENVFVVEAPPKRLTGRGSASRKLALRVAALKGQWVRIAEYPAYQQAHNKATDIRRGNLVGWSQVGTFEAKVREIPDDDGEGSVFGLWVRCTHMRKAVENELDQ